DTLHRRDNKGKMVVIPRNSVLVRFNTPELPEEVTIGKRKLRVFEFVAPPPQCFNCQRFGHLARDCRSKVRCRKCAGNHNNKRCKSTTSTCANCSGQHWSSFKQCPARLETIKRKRDAVLHRAPPTKTTKTTKAVVPSQTTKPEKMCKGHCESNEKM